MPQPVTTIFLAPSGAGKTTTIDRLARNALPFAHVDRDRIMAGILDEFRLNSALCLGAEDRKRINQLCILADDKYAREFAGHVERQTPHLVVDQPPSSGQGEGWAVRAVKLSKDAGRQVIVEAITVNPEIALPRVLRRNSVGMDMISQRPDIMSSDGNYFRSWLFTYKNLPDQFLLAAEIADVARLHDNNGSEPRLIAEWQNGNCRIIDNAALHQFLRLKDVNPEAARFEARVTQSAVENGYLTHRFETTASRFFGPDAPSLKTQVFADPTPVS